MLFKVITVPSTHLVATITRVIFDRSISFLASIYITQSSSHLLFLGLLEGYVLQGHHHAFVATVTQARINRSTSSLVLMCSTTLLRAQSLLFLDEFHLLEGHIFPRPHNIVYIVKCVCLYHEKYSL